MSARVSKRSWKIRMANVPQRVLRQNTGTILDPCLVKCQNVIKYLTDKFESPRVTDPKSKT